MATQTAPNSERSRLDTAMKGVAKAARQLEEARASRTFRAPRGQSDADRRQAARDAQLATAADETRNQSGANYEVKVVRPDQQRRVEKAAREYEQAVQELPALERYQDVIEEYDREVERTERQRNRIGKNYNDDVRAADETYGSTRGSSRRTLDSDLEAAADRRNERLAYERGALGDAREEHTRAREALPKAQEQADVACKAHDKWRNKPRSSKRLANLSTLGFALVPVALLTGAAPLLIAALGAMTLFGGANAIRAAAIAIPQNRAERKNQEAQQKLETAKEALEQAAEYVKDAEQEFQKAREADNPRYEAERQKALDAHDTRVAKAKNVRDKEVRDAGVKRDRAWDNARAPWRDQPGKENLNKRLRDARDAVIAVTGKDVRDSALKKRIARARGAVSGWAATVDGLDSVTVKPGDKHVDVVTKDEREALDRNLDSALADTQSGLNATVDAVLLKTDASGYLPTADQKRKAAQVILTASSSDELRLGLVAIGADRKNVDRMTQDKDGNRLKNGPEMVKAHRDSAADRTRDQDRGRSHSR
jgi:hypothetical protein